MRSLTVHGVALGCEDLLGRPEWRPARGAFEQAFGGRRLLVTGAAGSIGQALVVDLAELGADVVAVDVDEERLYRLSRALGAARVTCVLADVADPDQLGPVMRRHSPQVVFHLAAKKHVLFAESAVRLTVLTNVVGAVNLLAACRQLPSLEAVILASTDKTVAARNVMGLTKRLAERLFLQARGSGLPAAVVRLCNVLGSSSNVLETYVRRALQGEALEVYSADLSRYFCSLYEAVDLLKSAVSHLARAPVSTLDVGPPLAMAEFASRVARSLGELGHPAVTAVLEKLDEAEARHEELWSAGEEVLRPARVPGVAFLTGADRLTIEPEVILGAIREGGSEAELLERLKEWAGQPGL